MQPTPRPIVAGIFNIVTGALGIIWGLCVFVSFIAMTVTLDIYIPVFPEFFSGLVLAIAIFSLVVGWLTLVGGIYALQRRYWGLALAGSIAGVFTIFFLGIPALVLVAASKDEFS